MSYQLSIGIGQESQPAGYPEIIAKLRQLGQSSRENRIAQLKEQLRGSQSQVDSSSEEMPPGESLSATIPVHMTEQARKLLSELGIGASRLIFPEGIVDGGSVMARSGNRRRIELCTIRLEYAATGIGLHFSAEGQALNLIVRLPRTDFALRAPTDS